MTDETTDDLLYFNGINGETGDYDLPPMTGNELAKFIKGQSKPENLEELRGRHKSKGTKHLGVKEGVDPKQLDESGWGIIFAQDADPAIKEALAPLLKLRASQAGERFRLYEGLAGHRPDESKANFLARHKMGPGPADPDKVPYYLLICGSPERIDYRFQSQLDVQYAVGRIHFDSIDEYANYAASVVAAETGLLKLPRQVQFFGVANPMDQATNLSAKQLVTPLKEQLSGQFADWTFGSAMAEEATKARLATLLGGGETPALLFTASHGMDFPMTSTRQMPHQGALLCQDWPGPNAHRGPIPEDFYFAGADLDSNSNLLGLIAFFFACYGAGTPQMDEFAKQAFKERSQIAPRPFMAGLPTRMLGLPRGGALAAIGHVERAWTYSFRWQKAGSQTEVFRSTLHRLLDGHPVGSALEFFNERYAELSTVLADELDHISYGKHVDPYDLAGMWTANNDARGYALIGDPAVRLPVAQPEDAAQGRRPLEVRAAALTSTTSGDAAAGARIPAQAAEDEPPGAEWANAHASSEAAVAPIDPSDVLTVSTYTSDDPAAGGAKTLVARTRFTPSGEVETVIAAAFADHNALLRFHGEQVGQAIAARHVD